MELKQLKATPSIPEGRQQLAHLVAGAGDVIQVDDAVRVLDLDRSAAAKTLARAFIGTAMGSRCGRSVSSAVGTALEVATRRSTASMRRNGVSFSRESSWRRSDDGRAGNHGAIDDLYDSALRNDRLIGGRKNSEERES